VYRNPYAAATLNMEMGVLVSGGVLPAQVERQVERLMEMKLLREVGRE
jgi:hypothetical protein